jgi:hypothetical protein
MVAGARTAALIAAAAVMRWMRFMIGLVAGVGLRAALDVVGLVHELGRNEDRAGHGGDGLQDPNVPDAGETASVETRLDLASMCR